MISISSRTFDMDGQLLIRRPSPGTAFDRGRRRLSRSATLDGEVTIFDGGFSHGDRTFIVVVNQPSRTLVDAAKRLLQSYRLLTVSVREGCYRAAPESYTADEGKLTLVLLVKEKVSE